MEPASPAASSWPAELVLLTADDRAALRRRAGELAGWLRRSGTGDLAGVAAACARESGAARLAIVARDVEELTRKLDRASARLGETGRSRIRTRSGTFWFESPMAGSGALAFVFPGEGSQYPGMHRELYAHVPAFREALDGAHRSLRESSLLDDLLGTWFPPDGEGPGDGQGIFAFEAAIASITTAELALLRLLRKLGLAPQAVVGHSSGEYAALAAADALPAERSEDLLELVGAAVDCQARIETRDLVPDAVLAAVSGPDLSPVPEALAAAGGEVSVGMDNCPHQAVLVGPTGAMERAMSRLRERGGLLVQRLPWERGYHTAAFADGARVVRERLERLPIRAPRVPVWSCAAVEPFPADRDGMTDLFARQWKESIRFRETIEGMYRSGIRMFLEVGPGATLTGFIDDILGERPHLAVPVDDGRGRLRALWMALGDLAARGVPVDLGPLFDARGVEASRLPWLPSGTPPPSPRQQVRSVAAPSPVGAAARRQLAGFQATMAEFLRVQERVMRMHAARRGGSRRVREAPAPRFPFLRRVLRHEPGVRLAATCDIGETEPLLRDHTFFGRDLSSSDPSLTAYVVMPLAMSLELMAQAALSLRPGLRIVALRDVTTARWITFDKPSLRLRVEAEAAEGGRVAARLLVPDAAGGEACAAAATFELSRHGAPLPPASLECPPVDGWAYPPHQIYGRDLFQGPRLQGIRSIRSLHHGAVCTAIEEPDPGPLAARPPALPVALLDIAAQLPTLPTLTRWDPADDHAEIVFPNGFSRLELAAPWPAGRVTAGRCRAQRAGDRVDSTVEMIDAAGRVLLRVTGQRGAIHRIPSGMYRNWSAPLEVTLNHDVTDRFAGVPGIDAVRLCITRDSHFAALIHGLWRECLARMVLDRAERAEWSRLRLPPVGLARWLLGRCAAKDAARLLVLPSTRMADVGISADEAGRPALRGEAARLAHLGIAAAGPCAAGAAADARRFDGVGIDLEEEDSIHDDATAPAFTEEEHALVAKAAASEGSPVARWYAALRAAKGAVREGLGRGLPGGNGEISARAVDPASGRVRVAVRGGGASTQTAEAHCRRLRGLTMAIYLRSRSGSTDG